MHLFAKYSAVADICFEVKNFTSSLSLIHFSHRLFSISSVSIGSRFRPTSAFPVLPIEIAPVGQTTAHRPHPKQALEIEILFDFSSNVEIHSFGLSSNNQSRRLISRSGDSSYGAVASRIDSEAGETIHLQTGDDVVSTGIEPPQMLKIDVEGHEPDVLIGLHQTICRFRPAIFFEHIFLSDEVLRGMVPTGYRLSFLLDDGSWTKDFHARHRGHEAFLEPLVD